MAAMGTSSRKRAFETDDESECSSSSADSKHIQRPERLHRSDSKTKAQRKANLEREQIAAAKLQLETERAQFVEHRSQLQAQFLDLESFETSVSGENQDATGFLGDIQQAIKAIEAQEEQLNAKLAELDEEFRDTFHADTPAGTSGQGELQQQIQRETQRLQDLQGRRMALTQKLTGMDIDRKSTSKHKRKRRRVEAEDRVLRWLNGSCMEPVAGAADGLRRTCSGEAVIDTQA